MGESKRVAIITGGASGMGLETSRQLAAKGGWNLHLVDMNEKAGAEVASTLGATFHRADVTDYSSLAGVFEKVFKATGRLDFVFANAGIAEKVDFYKNHDTGASPPPPPDLLVSKICFDSVVTTSYLAQHYFRQTPNDVATDKVLVMTASCGAIYPSYYSAVYSGAKHGVLGFARCVARSFWNQDRIRVNTICPGIVKTALLTLDQWKSFPEDQFTTVEKIGQVVMMLVEGEDKEPEAKTRIDGKRKYPGGLLRGESVEISGKNHYYREAPAFCDDSMKAVMGATEMESGVTQ